MNTTTDWGTCQERPVGFRGALIRRYGGGVAVGMSGLIMQDPSLRNHDRMVLPGRELRGHGIVDGSSPTCKSCSSQALLKSFRELPRIYEVYQDSRRDRGA